MGCASSKHLETVLKAEGIERYSKSLRKKNRNKKSNGVSSHNNHHVALTSSTYGVFSPETFESDVHEEEKHPKGQKGKNFDSPRNQVYEKLKSFELSPESGPQSWSEVSKVLDNLKPEMEKMKEERYEEKYLDGDNVEGREIVKSFNSEGMTFHTVEELDAKIGRGELKKEKTIGVARIAYSNGVGSPRKDSNRYPSGNSNLMSNGRDVVGSVDLGSRKKFHGPNLDLKETRGSEPSVAPKSPLFEPELLVSFEDRLRNNLSGDEWNAIRNMDDTHDEKHMNAVLNEETWRDKPNQKPSSSSVGNGASEFAYVKESPHRVVETTRKSDPLQAFEEKCPPGGEKGVVLYTTTLRGIRKTFEDCNKVRTVIESYGVPIDERDVSMHLEFRNELKELMGKPTPVPRLFIKGRYIGGAEDVLQLNDDGKLDELLNGLSTGIVGKVCEGCGGMRFVPCLQCSGSCKLIKDENVVVRCPHCNENGLIQCPMCH